MSHLEYTTYTTCNQSRLITPNPPKLSNNAGGRKVISLLLYQDSPFPSIIFLVVGHWLVLHRYRTTLQKTTCIFLL
ncbi:hypothetical protein RclHR1_00240041 [Rhizophagus clarus]|uniref:Uncharacterized protein n=1 Tax=Rhizophagus clarus TaxID=94130 RepID=A0A2Z6QWM6_9GLOM|nr:hypothetical protein RclHR1_00240041 [Rhizophagus clarus]GES78350.1 hypothetical protein RCL_jg15129.t1 [Rhizophagus clarus]